MFFALPSNTKTNFIAEIQLRKQNKKNYKQYKKIVKIRATIKQENKQIWNKRKLQKEPICVANTTWYFLLLPFLKEMNLDNGEYSNQSAFYSKQ